MSPHGLAAVGDPFQLTLSPETPFAEALGSSYPLPVLLLGGSYSHFICVWASDPVLRSYVHIRASHVLPGQVWVRWGLITNTPQISCHSAIIRISGGPGWTGRVAGRFQPLLFVKAGPSSGTNSGVLIICAELCSVLASTSWESAQFLLSWWWLSEPLGEWSHFFCVEMARNSANGCLSRGVPTKEISSKGGTGGGGIPGGSVGLLKGPGAGEPSGLDAFVVALTSSPCCAVVASTPLM